MKGLVVKPNIETKGIYIEMLDVKGLDYRDIQKIVGGIFDVPYISENLRKKHIDCFINDEGKYLDLGISAVIIDKEFKVIDYIKGNMLFIGNNRAGETIGLTDSQIDYLMNHYLKIGSVIDNNCENLDVLIID